MTTKGEPLTPAASVDGGDASVLTVGDFVFPAKREREATTGARECDGGPNPRASEKETPCCFDESGRCRFISVRLYQLPGFFEASCFPVSCVTYGSYLRYAVSDNAVSSLLFFFSLV